MVYKCSKCKLMFGIKNNDNNNYINNINKVKFLNKKCVKCSVYSPRPYKVPPIDINHLYRTNMCLRCGVYLKKDIEMCPVCLCVDIVTPENVHDKYKRY